MKIAKLIPGIVAIAIIGGCAKTAVTGKNEANKRYFDAWVHVQKQEHPEFLWEETPLGCWILANKEGDGETLAEINDSLYARVHYTLRYLDGEVSSSSTEAMDKQLGSYSDTVYYGPRMWYVEGLSVGVRETLAKMKTGGECTIVVPGWLSGSDEYDSKEDYLAKVTGDDMIYEIKLIESVPSIKEWELERIKEHLEAEYKDMDDKVSNDTTGFWYVQLEEPQGQETFKDTTIYINYIGRLLDNSVFDTSIRDTAVRYGIYSSSREYGPVQVTYPSEDESYTEITFGSDDSSVIDGFAKTLSLMKPYEKGVGIFWSWMGYSYSGSGKKIPAYAPLKFEIEIVDEP